jgi:hypothetical protein
MQSPLIFGDVTLTTGCRRRTKDNGLGTNYGKNFFDL